MNGQGPPQVAPPGLASTMAMTAGFNRQYGTTFAQVNQYGQLGQAQAGTQMADFLGNTAAPFAVHSGMGAVMLGAPILAAGGRTAFTRGLGHALQWADPMHHMGTAARFGFSAAGGGSWAAGTGALGALKNARTIGSMAAGIGRVGMAGAAGAAVAALPLAAGIAATEGMVKVGEQVFHGAQQGMVGSALMSSMGGQFGGGVQHGADVGKLLASQGREIGKGVGQMADMVREMDSMKLFQTTRDVKEFKERFTKIMDTVKEVASTMQTSVDDALKMVGEMRTQGFYTTSDIKAASLRQTAREGMSGLSTGQMVAAGRFGARYARALGMRGRFGSDFAQQQTAGVAYAMRQGLMSEEAIMEAGGVEQVGAGLAATQMRFMRSSRGRVMIANMLGQGRQMDPDRVNRFLSGDMSLESMVTGAAGRGLGVLGAAGSSEARENAMQYAGMGMVSMAAAQSRQLYGGYNRRGIIGMLGTMGVGRSQANLLLQQTMAMPQILEQQAAAEYGATQRSQWEQDRAYHSVGSSVERYLFSGDQGFTRGIFGRARGWGEDIYNAGSRSWRGVARAFGQPVISTGGGDSDIELSRRYGRGDTSGMELESYERGTAGNLYESGRGAAMMGAAAGLGGLIGGAAMSAAAHMTGWSADRGSIVGGTPTIRERYRAELSAYTVGNDSVMDDRRGDYVDLGHGRFIKRSDITRGLRAAGEGILDDDQRTNLTRVTGGGGDVVDRAQDILSARGKGQLVSDLQGIQSAEGWSDLTQEERSGFLVASATDKLSGDHKTGVLGSGGVEQFIADKDYRTRIMHKLSKDRALVDSGIIRKRGVLGLGSVSDERGRFRESFAATLNQFGETGDTIDEEGLSDTLSTDAKARRAFARYLQARKDGDQTKVAEAMQDLQPYEQLHKLAQRADADTAYGGSLDLADLLGQIGRLATAEHRGRSQSRAAARAKRSVGAFGGRFDDHLDRLDDGSLSIDEYAKRSTAFARSVVSDREIDADEQKILEQVFGVGGGRFADTFRGLVGGDRETVKKLGKKLHLSEEEVDMISYSDSAHRTEEVVKILADKGLLDPSAFGSAGGTEVGDTRTAYAQANTRFVIAVDRCLSNLTQDNPDLWKPQDYTDLMNPRI